MILSLFHFICELFNFIQTYLNLSYVHHFILGVMLPEKWS